MLAFAHAGDDDVSAIATSAIAATAVAGKSDARVGARRDMAASLARRAPHPLARRYLPPPAFIVPSSKVVHLPLFPMSRSSVYLIALASVMSMVKRIFIGWPIIV